MIRIDLHKWFWGLFALLFLYGAYGWWSQRPLAREPGILAPDLPRQMLLAAAPAFDHQGHTIKPLAEYRIRARVIGKEPYRFDSTADISPYDLALGWGPLSDSAVLRQIDFSQSSRWLSYRWQHTPPLPPQVISAHTANVHVIPADRSAVKALQRIRPGHVVELSGYLVEVQMAGGSWASSLSREDTGDGACEIMWVEQVSIQ